MLKLANDKFLIYYTTVYISFEHRVTCRNKLDYLDYMPLYDYYSVFLSYECLLSLKPGITVEIPICL